MLDFLTDADEAVICLFGVRQCFPIFKIHVSAALVDVIRHHPRQRRNVDVPRPMGLVGMAVSTGADQGRVDVFGDAHMS